MLDRIIISFVITVSIAFVVETTKLFRRLKLRRRIIELIDQTTAVYVLSLYSSEDDLREGRRAAVDVNRLGESILDIIEKMDLKKFVTRFEVSFQNNSIFQFIFELEKYSQKSLHRFSVGIGDIESIFKKM